MAPTPRAGRRAVLQLLPALAVIALLTACAQESGANVPNAPRVLPPDPVLGPDADGDGVRDDIAEYLDVTLADEPLAHRAALQYAKVRRAELATPVTREAVVAAVAATARAHECVLHVQRQHPPDLRDGRIIHEIDARTLDTDARINAHFTRHKLIGSMHYALTDIAQAHTTCDFDTSSLGGAP